MRKKVTNSLGVNYRFLIVVSCDEERLRDLWSFKSFQQSRYEVENYSAMAAAMTTAWDFLFEEGFDASPLVSWFKCRRHPIVSYVFKGSRYLTFGQRCQLFECELFGSDSGMRLLIGRSGVVAVFLCLSCHLVWYYQCSSWFVNISSNKGCILLLLGSFACRSLKGEHLDLV